MILRFSKKIWLVNRSTLKQVTNNDFCSRILESFGEAVGPGRLFQSILCDLWNSSVILTVPGGASEIGFSEYHP